MARIIHDTKAGKKDVEGLSLDELDHRNLINLMKFYEHAFPGQIAWLAKDSRKEIIAERKIKGAKQGITRRVSMPRDLYMELKRGYPAIFSDKAQMEKFLKWFPVFDMERK